LKIGNCYKLALWALPLPPLPVIQSHCTALLVLQNAKFLLPQGLYTCPSLCSDSLELSLDVTSLECPSLLSLSCCKGLPLSAVHPVLSLHPQHLPQPEVLLSRDFGYCLLLQYSLYSLRVERACFGHCESPVAGPE
jgi:hypothetical protein